MDVGSIVLLVVATLLPPCVSAVFFQLERTSAFGRLGHGTRQAIIGVAFGLIAVFGTERGVAIGDATINVRDAAPLVAGLLFGGRAGIIAGVLGGVERWFAALWGRGMFTRVACSVATAAAGLYAALLRRHLFEGRRPSLAFAGVVGVVGEVLHLMLIFVTNFEEAQRGLVVVMACTAPMVICVAVSVMLSTLVVARLAGEPLFVEPTERGIAESVQHGMLVATLVSFAGTLAFSFVLFDNVAAAQVRTLLTANVEDVSEDVSQIVRSAAPGASLDSLVRGVTHNMRVGKDGSVFVANGEGTVVSTRDDLAPLTLADLGLADAPSRVGEVFEAEVQGVTMLCLAEGAHGYTVVATEPVREARFAREASVLVGAHMEILVFATLFLLIYLLVKRLVVDNVLKVNATLAKITDGDLKESVEVRANREFAALSDDINTMVGTLAEAIEAEARRIDAELEYARSIQLSALPRIFPPYPAHDEFELYATMDAAREVGGDFYDFYLTDDDHLAFLIADVSGKGIPASLFMMSAKTFLKSIADTTTAVGEVVRRANDALCAENDADMFVTVWMGIMDLASGHVEYVNAGHNPPAVLHGDGTVTLVEVRPNPMVGVCEGYPFATHELDLKVGDTVFLYTDGVTEATDAADALFGDARLLETLRLHGRDGVEELLGAVRTAVDDFVGDAPQFDDITMLALRYRGREA